MKNRTNKRVTVSIGIPVYNEASNIVNLINSILKQKLGPFTMEKIYVVNDGSSDATADVVKRLAKIHPAIKFVNNRGRKGKGKRLKQLYKLTTSDITCVFDGDVILGTDKTIYEICKKFKNEKVVLVGCSKSAVKSEKLVGEVINTVNEIWNDAKINEKKGINIYNISSCGFGVRTSFAKKLPQRFGLLAETEFLYFNALEQNLKISFSQNALVFFRNPDNLTEYFSQVWRADNSSIVVQRYGNLSNKVYNIPAINKLKSLIKNLLKKPLLTPMAILLIVTIKIIPSKKDPLTGKGMWQTVLSSKKAIDVQI